MAPHPTGQPPFMANMNLSRYTYFKALVASVLRRCGEDKLSAADGGRLSRLLRSVIKISGVEDRRIRLFLESVADEINIQTQRIYSKQEGGYWPITAGDKIFIGYMNNILAAIDAALVRRPVGPEGLRILANRLGQILAGAQTEHNPRIRAVFLVQETYTWPSLESVYEAFVADPAAEAQLVYVPFEHSNSDKSRDWFAEYRDKGLPIVSYQDYDLSAESPDLAFFVKPYDSVPKQFYIDDVDRVVQRSVYIPYGIRWAAYQEVPLLIDYHFRLPLHDKAWRIINAPNDILENYIRYGYRNGENVRLIGHPRFDGFAKLEKLRDDIPLAWKSKLHGRKVVMWNTHFSNRSADHAQVDWATFEVFGRDILSYFGQDKEIALLWRPHPLFFNGLIRSEIMTSSEVDELKADIESSDNIILDTLADYRYAFSVADALISDASGFLPEFLITGKPILYTYLPGKYLMVNKSQLPAYYKGGAWDAIKEFIERVKEGKDSRQEERAEVLKSFGIAPGRKIGEIIKDHCITDLIDEEIRYWQAR